MGHLLGVAAAVCALTLATIGLWLLLGPWGVLAAAAMWAAPAAILIDPAELAHGEHPR